MNLLGWDGVVRLETIRERTPHPSSESCDAIYKDEGSMGVSKGKMRSDFSILLATLRFVKVSAGDRF
jgi:hypothetical protein